MNQMRNSDSDQFQRKLQQFQSQNRQRQIQKRLLQSKLQFKKLQLQYNSLWANYQAVEEDRNNMEQTLQNIIPENEQLKKVIQQLKFTLEGIHYKEGEYVQEIESKDRLIQQLTGEIENLNQHSDYRKSDLSNIGDLAISLQEKAELEERIQELKNEKLTDNENYEKKLMKKDQIIKSINAQSQQNEQYYKDIIAKKMSMITSLQQEERRFTTANEEIDNELRTLRQNQQSYISQIQRLNQLVSHLNQKLNTKTTLSQRDSISSQEQYYEQQRQLANLRERCDQLRQEQGSLNRENQQTTIKFKALIDEDEQLKLQNEQLKLQNEQLVHLNQQLTKENNTLNEEVKQLQKENLQLAQSLNQLKHQHQTQVHISANISKEIELNQHYLQLLEQSKRQLAANSTQLKNTFAELQHKHQQLKLKENQISQLKSTIANNQQDKAYFENLSAELQQDKNNLFNKLEEKDTFIKSLEKKNQHITDQTYKMRRKIEELQSDKKYLQKEKDKQKEKTSSAEHFYDCSDEKELLQQELRDTIKSLQSAKSKSQQYIKEINFLSQQNNQLKSMIENSPQKKSFHKDRQTSEEKILDQQFGRQNYEAQLKRLKQQNQKLEQKLNEKSTKLQQKNNKLQKLQTQLRSEYQKRIHSLQQQIYRLSELENQRQQPQSEQICIDYKDDMMIDDLDDQFQLQLKNQPIGQSPQQQFDQVDFDQLRQAGRRSSEKSKRSSEKREHQADPQVKSKQSQNSGQSRDYKVKYSQLRVQNDSLQAHLERLSAILAQTKEQLQMQQGKNQKLINSIQQREQHTESLQKKVKLLERQLHELKEDQERFQTLKQLMKIQKSQSKQKSNTITELEDKLTKLQRAHKELKQDYSNLQSLNEETTEKYKKTMQNLKRETNDMNEVILKEKTLIEDKKKEMKKLEGEYMGRISMYEDENMGLKSRAKKLQLQNAKLEQRVKELQEDHFEKVIITRTQFLNYKQTEKRLEELQDHINSLVNDKNKVIGEKKSMDRYFEEQIALLKTTFSNEREKLLKRLTEIEQVKNDYEVKIEKLKEILDKNRQEYIDLQNNLQKTSKDNYHIKLELSEALSETNMHLVKNKTLGERLEQMENELDQLRNSYEGLLMEKSKTQKDTFSQSGIKVELQMAYKQIEKLNDVLMEKEKQVKYLLTQPNPSRTQPTTDRHHTYNDNSQVFVDRNPPFVEKTQTFIDRSQPFNQRPSRTEHFVPKQKSDFFYQNKAYNRSYQNLRDRSRSRSTSRDVAYKKEQFLVQPQIESHYKTSRIQTKFNDYGKQPTSHKYQEQKGNTLFYEIPGKRNQQNVQFQAQTQKLIGGFPPQYCTFSPEYHRI